jgi:hypothetical protein
MTCPKIIFLDIDGPMIPARAMFIPTNGLGRWGWTFDPCAVHMLNFLHWADPTVQVVLSTHRWGDKMLRSPYKDFPSIEEKEFWLHHFKKQKLNIRLHDDWLSTRTFMNGHYIKRAKVLEIREWLSKHPDVKHWVCLEDDLNGGDMVTERMRKDMHLVGEDYDDGLTWADFRKMCQYLRIDLKGNKYMEYNVALESA